MILLLLIMVLTVFAGFFLKSYMTESAGSYEMILDKDIEIVHHLTSKQWWAKKRINYNIGLVVAGITAFIAYAVLGEILIAPYDISFEVTLFTILFQGTGYLFMMLLANLFYNLGPLVDKLYNKYNSNRFRQQLYNFGFWFSIGLPFIIPAFIVVEYFLRFT